MVSEVKRYYDERAPTYDAQSELFYFRVYDTVTWRYTEPYVPKDSEALVLDAAGGTGKWTIPIAKCGPKVVLVDVSDEMLEVTRKKITEQGLQGRITALKGDIRRLDFRDETFDMVFCDHALCFIREQGAVIKELVRVLKTNHRLVISGQNRYVLALSLMDDVDFAAKVLSNEAQFLMAGRLKVYTHSPDEFKRLLNEHAIEIEKIIGKGVTMPLIFPLQRPYPKDDSPEFLEKVLKIELALCDTPDALALAGHLQAVGYKKSSTKAERRIRTSQ